MAAQPPARRRAQLRPALPRTASVDLRVSRSFQLQGTAKIEVLVEAFNLFNRINYTAVNSTFYAIGGTAAAPTLDYNSATFACQHQREQRHVRAEAA